MVSRGSGAGGEDRLGCTVSLTGRAPISRPGRCGDQSHHQPASDRAAKAAVRVVATSSDSTVLVANPHGWNWMPPEALTTHRPPFFTPLATVGTVEGDW